MSEELGKLKARVAALEAQLAGHRSWAEASRNLVRGFLRIAWAARSCFWLYELEARRFRYVSPGYEELFGRSRASLDEEPHSWLSVVHPDDRTRVVDAFRSTVAGEPSQAEYRVILAGDEVRWMWGQAAPVPSADGSVRFVVAYAQDVTERKRAQTDLEQSQARFRRLLDSNIIGIVIADVGGRLVDANDAFLDLVGYERSDLPIRWEALTPHEFRAADAAAIDEVRRRGVTSPYEKEYIRKDGSRVSVLVGGAVLDPPTLAIGVVADLTARRRAEAALRRAKAELEERVEERTAALAAARDHLRLITDSLPVLIGYVGPDRRYSFTNATHDRWVGAPDALRGRHLRTLFGEPAYASLEPIVGRAFCGEPGSWAGEVVFPTGARHVLVSLVPHEASDGGVVGLYVLVSDVTEQKRAEQELRRTERLASIGTLAAGIAHEINNPVGVIMLAAREGSEEAHDPEAVREALRAIERSARRCRNIVTNVLKFAREATSTKRLGDLNVVAEHALRDATSQVEDRDAKIVTDLAEKAPLMIMNQTEIEQVVANLIHNALEAGATRIEVRTANLDEAVELSVLDDGDGIPPEAASRIFDPFYTLRGDSGGTGLGLSILHGIVRDHGGTVTVESAPGRGTRITASFPLGTPDDGSETPPDGAGMARPRGS